MVRVKSPRPERLLVTGETVLVASPPASNDVTDGDECNNEFGRRFVSCAICETRKEKRFCPALHDRICPQCCGEAREVTLDCPSDCVYLQQARQHERSLQLEQLETGALFPAIEVAKQFVYEHEHLLIGLSSYHRQGGPGRPHPARPGCYRRAHRNGQNL